MKLSIYFVAVLPLMIVFTLPTNSYSKDKVQSWAGTYVLMGGRGGLVIEEEGRKLWVEMWRDFKAGEVKRSGEETYEAVYFASIHGNTAKRLPFRGDICPHTFTLKANSVILADECKPGPPTMYHFERAK